MKVVILAGGKGTRIMEESTTRPKPMVEIGGRPILWHIMKLYSHFGLNDFVICCGYKGYAIKEYFINYALHMSDVCVDVQRSSAEVLYNYAEPWRVTLVDTGEATMTGGRLKRVSDYVRGGAFCLTYGDGLANVDIAAAISFHRREGRIATVTATQAPGRFGALKLTGSTVNSFQEKPLGDGGWINGGFFVLEPAALDYIVDDFTIWEKDPMERLARENQLGAWFHDGFWQPMDTLRDRLQLEELWNSGKAPWKLW
jgi:glucose-1-phosphate cytidylyltransferase